MGLAPERFFEQVGCCKKFYNYSAVMPYNAPLKINSGHRSQGFSLDLLDNCENIFAGTGPKSAAKSMFERHYNGFRKVKMRVKRALINSKSTASTCQHVRPCFFELLCCYAACSAFPVGLKQPSRGKWKLCQVKIN